MNSYIALLMAAVAAFFVTWILGYPLIPWLKKLKFGQTILDIGPKWHKHKQGIPTMGGMMFAAGILAAIAVTLATDKAMGGEIAVSGSGPTVPTELSSKLYSGLLMAAAFGILGFADDYVKVVKKRNKGLSITQKSIGQILIMGAYLTSLYMSMGRNPYTYIPFAGNVELGWFFWIFGAVVIYGTVNAVNFTDGIDGLCSSVTVTAALALVVIAVMRGMFGVGVLASAVAGGCAGFLMWNRNPAKVFMGDVGALFLGGMVVAVAFALNCPIIILFVGIVYVIEFMSDIIQIGYFKLTHGKRVFRMAPIHHHFEMGGWKEKKIVRVFTFVNLIGCAAGIMAVYLSK
ncbi:MAG: phospho-N-acetylmuramoyl-pentapeptide-transferase [Oscillospiraceae bacterium]|nr:phospho-N-acetylmuramoyl-pentapeptide-transferase [Oscillospiraceae bacterium]